MAVNPETVITTASDAASPAVTVSLTSFTVTSANYLVATLTLNQGVGTNPSLVWDPAGANQSMTNLGHIDDPHGVGNGTTYFFGLPNPAAGASKTIKASWTGGSDSSLCAISFTGVDDSGTPATQPATTATVSSGTAAVTVPSAAGNYVLAAYTTAQAFSTPNQTSWFMDNSPATFSAAGNRAVGSASVAMSFTLAGSQQWGAIGISINAPPATTTTPYAGINIMRVQPPGFRWHRDFSGWRPAPFERRRILRPSRQIMLPRRAPLIVRAA